MTDIIDDIEPTEDELTSLKKRADVMGVKYHPNISVDKLKAKIQESLDEKSEAPEPSVKPKVVSSKLNPHLELVRVRVTCMDQSKANQSGIIFTVGNSKVGTIKKYVPFDVEWHIPRLMFETMKEAKTQLFFTVKDDKGNDITKSKSVNTYAIEVLPPLTEAELKDLAQRQAMANGTA